MNVNVSIWTKLSRVVIFLLFLAGLIAVAVSYRPLIKQNENLRKEILRLDAQLQKEEETGKHLKSNIEALRKDPKAVERLARERFGYAKTGEIMIRFEAATPTNSPATGTR
jgi:cell division protein FtsB